MSSIETSYIVTAVIGILLGFGIFLAVRFLLPRRLKATYEAQREMIVQKARERQGQLVQEAKKRADEKLQQMNEELEVTLEEERLSLESLENDYALQEQFAEHEEERIQKLEASIQLHQKKISDLEESLTAQNDEKVSILVEKQSRLAQIADCDVQTTKQNISDTVLNDRRLDSQKRIKELVDDLESHSKKGAERVLSRILSRYQPTFVWPKSVNHVEIQNPRLFEAIASESSTLIQDLGQLSEGVELTLSPAEHEGMPSVIRLGGGYGIYKEAVRLTLEEVLPRGPSQWGRIERVYAKHRQAIEIQAAKLGRQAVNELKLTNIHEEIQKMVGALNWRTSYRQNQFHHSVEVSRLAGLLASEMGVDPQIAKRCGLLHDIGKGIDYRIEGSHAVISGDYADRFGEKRIVCDTVMSHHNDLVLDTPLSFVLKSADTLSGARPGARINLEEGYQERLHAMEEAIKTFSGIQKVAIMNGGREVHIGVNHKRIREEDLQDFCAAIARKIEEDVAFPGQIKVLVTRRFEATAVA
ncbi:MAG: Rnase Y domain-containing protein [Bdellovibrionota bacterium]